MLKQKTVYFREEDLPLWEKISNKAEFLHRVLNPIIEPDEKLRYGTAEKIIIKTPKQAEEAIENIPKDDSWAGPLWKKSKK